MILADRGENEPQTAARSWGWYVSLAQLSGFPARLRSSLIEILTAELQPLAVSARRNESRWAAREGAEADEELDDDRPAPIEPGPESPTQGSEGGAPQPTQRQAGRSGLARDVLGDGFRAVPLDQSSQVGEE